VTRIRNEELLALLADTTPERLDRIMPTAVLTQGEAAAILRCSTKKIQRLRRAGKLAYLPGRPIMIKAKDLLLCIHRLTWPATNEAIGKSVGPAREQMAIRAARVLAQRRAMRLSRGV